MLIKIVICDDDKEIIKLVRFCLKKYAKSRGYDIEVTAFESGVELLEKWTGFDVLLLDIDMPEMDGIEVAEVLNTKGIMGRCRIVILSGIPERFQETYRIMAKDFIIKPPNEKKMFDSLDFVLRDIDPGEKVRVRFGNIEREVYERDIIYVRASGNYCNIYTTHGVGSIYMPMDILMQNISDSVFFRCHRSYIVNYEFVRRSEKNEIILKNREKLPLSRTRKKSFEKAFQDYIFRGIG